MQPGRALTLGCVSTVSGYTYRRVRRNDAASSLASGALAMEEGRVQQQGFTLMELVIVMVVIGVLTAIAIPNYAAYIQRSRRAEARNQVLEATVGRSAFAPR